MSPRYRCSHVSRWRGCTRKVGSFACQSLVILKQVQDDDGEVQDDDAEVQDDDAEVRDDDAEVQDGDAEVQGSDEEAQHGDEEVQDDDNPLFRHPELVSG